MDQLFDFIKDYGGYAGAASVLGLAVLSLLYFAQAREVRRLREWAGRAPERASELEQRVSEVARRPAPAPVGRQPVVSRQPGQPKTAAAQAAAQPAATPANGLAGGVPAGAVASGAAPAGGAGATAAAAAAAAAPGAQPATPAGGDGEAAKPEGDATPAADATKVETPPTTPAADAPAAAASTPAGTTPPPATPPPTGDGPATPPPAPTPRPAAATPPPRTAAAARPPTPAPAPRAAQPLRSSTAAARSRPVAPAAPQRSRRLPVILIAAAIGVVLVGVALALTLGGGDGENSASQQNPPANTVAPAVPEDGTSTGESGGSEGRPPSETTVAVLNGTTISGLAARTADELKDEGYALGTVADAQDQNRSATMVQFAEGARSEGQAVAKIIGVGADALSPIDVNTRTVAGDNARVVVTVGADQNQQSGQG